MGDSLPGALKTALRGDFAAIFRHSVGDADSWHASAAFQPSFALASADPARPRKPQAAFAPVPWFRLLAAASAALCVSASVAAGSPPWVSTVGALLAYALQAGILCFAIAAISPIAGRSRRAPAPCAAAVVVGAVPVRRPRLAAGGARRLPAAAGCSLGGVAVRGAGVPSARRRRGGAAGGEGACGLAAPIKRPGRQP